MCDVPSHLHSLLWRDYSLLCGLFRKTYKMSESTHYVDIEIIDLTLPPKIPTVTVPFWDWYHRHCKGATSVLELPLVVRIIWKRPSLSKQGPDSETQLAGNWSLASVTEVWSSSGQSVLLRVQVHCGDDVLMARGRGSPVLFHSWRQKCCKDKEDNWHASHSAGLKTIKGGGMREKSNFYKEMSAVNLMQVQYSPNKGHVVSPIVCGSLKTCPCPLPAVCFSFYQCKVD